MNEGVGVLLENENQFLLLLRSNDEFWECPKGHIEKEESHKTAIHRELEEETGIVDIEIKEKIGVLSFKFKSKTSGEQKQRDITYYHVISKTNDVTVSNEHKSYVWVNKDDLFLKLKFNDIKILLSSFFDEKNY